MDQSERIPIRPYRPSNGTEGMIFHEQFCSRCVKDRGYPDDDKEDNWCQLIANALAFNIGEPGYPSEWIKVGDEPQCTAFVEGRGAEVAS